MAAAEALNRFGPFVVFERLGAGGMAVVHRAHRESESGTEEVALKRLLPHLAEDAAFIRAFAREAQTAITLDHPNICQVYELGRVGETYFITMEYLDGCDARALLRRAHKLSEPLDPEVVVAILAQLCAGLGYAHAALDPETGEPLGLVHRDVSPANVLISRAGELKLIDFGIAKATLSKFRTETGRFRGKLGYLSPEAIKGDPLDGRSDLFSAGVIAYELLTARPLFGGMSDFETLKQVQFRDVAPPSQHNPRVSAELDRVILTALAKERDARYTSAEELRQDLLAAVTPAPARRLAELVGKTLADRAGPGLLADALARQVGGDMNKLSELVWGSDEPGGELPDVPDLAEMEVIEVGRRSEPAGSGTGPLVPPPPPPGEHEFEPVSDRRRQESLEWEALVRTEVSAEWGQHDTVLSPRLHRPTAVDDISPADAGPTIQTPRLHRDPADFETVQLSALEQVTSAQPTVATPPLSRAEAGGDSKQTAVMRTAPGQVRATWLWGLGAGAVILLLILLALLLG